MSGTTGERPFSDIVTSIRYWAIHALTIPMLLFLDGCLSKPDWRTMYSVRPAPTSTILKSGNRLRW